ncbi:helix-turn-helix transcriptional regulator [Amycolatopsis sp. OK19-0408]|uniref:Helix-turn-helix transcriptional regulator n=1 Tax=Amycolatopsis iheyensis TaxID=2945988 RepID=A0A9X2NA72_9PSEU|nr:helix-turn-helix transcriptional regulator [Amycolatopsis iheyensis]MCR6485011.1 helix-turn-helix transcriptional regulator [Amycolatopsis iheyensis]
MTGLVLLTETSSACGPLAHGEDVASHFHDVGQLRYAASGALVTTTRVGTWVAPANRITWMPPFQVHSSRSHGETDVRLLRVPATAAERLPAEPSVFAAGALLREAFLALLSDPDDGPRARLLLDVVITELTRAPQEPLRLPEPRDARLKAVTDLLHADPASPATLTELGRRTGASERTLSRLFGSELSMSFHQWRTLLRVQRALLELGAGTSVTDTAIRLGWANPSSFIVAFTELVGQTPGRYRGAGSPAAVRASQRGSASYRREPRPSTNWQP